ncbi:MAG: hypothetical protein AAB309_06405 [Deltaproteobacteria bacterium]
MKNKKDREITLLKKTFFAMLSVLVTASAINELYAEEGVEIEAVKEKSANEVAPAVSTPAVGAPAPKKKSPIGLGLTPLFGVMKSIDNNSLLVNKYTAGVAAEVALTPNIAVEGVLRYSEFNVRPDIFISTAPAPYISASYGSYGHPGTTGSPFYHSLGVVGSMRQTMVGGNLKYEPHPESLLSPFVGGGISHFSNEYTTSPKTSYIKVTFPQSVVGANVLGGLKLSLAKNFALLGRAEAGKLINNKNPEISSSIGTAKIQSYRNFRSYDKYWTALVGMTVGF